MRAINTVSRCDNFYYSIDQNVAAAWPENTAADGDGEGEEESAEGWIPSKAEEMPPVSAAAAPSAPPSSLLRVKGAKVEIPRVDRGFYVGGDGDTLIQLPRIITPVRLREVLGEKDVKSLSALRLIMKEAWDYITELDVDGLFGAPVSSPIWAVFLSPLRLKIFVLLFPVGDAGGLSKHRQSPHRSQCY
jgi:hypothetical protein